MFNTFVFPQRNIAAHTHALMLDIYIHTHEERRNVQLNITYMYINIIIILKRKLSHTNERLS
jgi:hypothetical protein